MGNLDKLSTYEVLGFSVATHREMSVQRLRTDTTE